MKHILVRYNFCGGLFGEDTKQGVKQLKNPKFGVLTKLNTIIPQK